MRTNPTTLKFHTKGYIPLLLVVLIFSIKSSLFAQNQSASTIQSEINNAKILANELYFQRPSENYSASGSFIVRFQDGRRTNIDVTITVSVENNSCAWRYDIHDGFKTRLLVISDQDKNINVWTYSIASNTFTRIEPKNWYQPFAGTDFWIFDLMYPALPCYQWPEQKIVKHEMRKGRSCRVLASINPHPGDEGYSKVLSWIDTETKGLIRAEAYDSNGQMIKEFNLSKVIKKDGYWQVKQLDIVNKKKKSKTTLLFNFD